MRWRREYTAQGEPIGKYPGVAELGSQRHLDTTALLNDLKRAGINADAQLNPDAFEELLRDEHRPTRGIRLVKDAQGLPTGLQVQGPGPEEWLPNDSRAPHYRPGTHWWEFSTLRWTEVPAFVAHWFWWAQQDDARLGAGYGRPKTKDERDPDESRNAVVTVPGVLTRLRLRWEANAEEGPAPAPLFGFRMQAERPQGYRPSGLIVPGMVNEDELTAARARIAELEATLAKTPRKG